MPRQSPRKRAAVNYDEDAGQKSNSYTAPKNSKAKVTATSKRKIPSSPTDNEEEDEEKATEGTQAKVESAQPVSKKRKTGKSKQDDAMPLSERTATSTLKHAMYIGAHISAAGGQPSLRLISLSVSPNPVAKSPRNF